ncbi:MAG: hypothetical protein AAGF71_02330 [Pseudomonadota bacterium]
MRQFHVNVILAVWLIIGTLLLLQFFLNSLKYQELIVGATSDRMQVTADIIESAIVRAEQIGLRIDEIENLGVLIERQLEQAPLIDDIRILDSAGMIISDTETVPLSDADRALVVRRVMSRDAEIVTFELGDRLFTSRVVLDSSSTRMGIILISTDRSIYQPSIIRAQSSLATSFLIVFLFVSLLAIPLVFLGFFKVTRALDFLEDKFIGTPADAARTAKGDFELHDLGKRIEEGNAAYEALGLKLDTLEQNTREKTTPLP